MDGKARHPESLKSETVKLAKHTRLLCCVRKALKQVQEANLTKQFRYLHE